MSYEFRSRGPGSAGASSGSPWADLVPGKRTLAQSLTRAAPVQLREVSPSPDGASRGEVTPPGGGELETYFGFDPAETPDGASAPDDGLPAPLRAGITALSGHDLSDVRVHRDSAEPAALGAHAFADSAAIHLGPGQEQHLPHEAWHVVQQRQGRVQATRQLKGVGVNDDAALEREADEMGATAARLGGHGDGEPTAPTETTAPDARDGDGIQVAVVDEDTPVDDAPAVSARAVQLVAIKAAVSSGGGAKLAVIPAAKLEFQLAAGKTTASALDVLGRHGIDPATTLAGEKGLPELLLRLAEPLKSGSHKILWTYEVEGGKKSTISWSFKIVAAPSSAKEEDDDDAPAKPTAAETSKNRLTLCRDVQRVMHAMGIPVVLVGGAAANVNAGSPRPVNDLDFKTTAVKGAFTGQTALIARINEEVETALGSEYAIETAFHIYEKDSNAIDAKIAGCGVTIARVLNPDEFAEYEIEGGAISALDLVCDKAATIIFRSDDTKKVTDLFDLLWGMKQLGIAADQLAEVVDDKRGGTYGKRVAQKSDKPLAGQLSTQLAICLQDLMQRGLSTITRMLNLAVGNRDAVAAIKPLLVDLCSALGVVYRGEPRGAVPGIIIQAGNMTGDMFGVSSALILNELTHVVVIRDGSDKDRTADIVGFYRSTVGDDQRIHVLDAAKTSAPEKKMGGLYTLYTGGTALPYAAVEPTLPPALQTPDRQRKVSFATATTAETFDARSRDKIITSWGVDIEGQAESLAAFLGGRGVPLSGGNCVVLWSRFSGKHGGKHGGAHAQHDTSMTGMRQMIHLARSLGSTVIICGDRPKGDALDDLTGEAVIDLCEFWKDSDWTAHFPHGGRTDQLLPFEHLHQCGTLKHLGFRSGNLEAYALLGHQVRYMEEEGNLQANRMEAWHSGRRGNIGYDRILIEDRVPTLTGQWVVENARDERRENKPPWIADPLGTHKESYIPGRLRDPDFERNRAKKRGFTVKDLEKIHQYLADDERASASTWLLELERKHAEYHERGWTLSLSDLDDTMRERLRATARAGKDPWLAALIDELEREDQEQQRLEAQHRREIEELNLSEVHGEFDMYD